MSHIKIIVLIKKTELRNLEFVMIVSENVYSLWNLP